MCHRIDAELLQSTYLRDKRLLQFKGVCLFDIGAEIQEMDETLIMMPNLKAHRYLDKFYLWTPENDSRRRQDVLDRFFELIANEYESLIDVQRNIENIRNLFEFLCELIDPIEGSIIVDYGCGTGLSIEPASGLDIELIGVDRCPTIRQIAASRGMKVWSPGELARQLNSPVHGAFASYVFHLLPHTYGLRLLWKRLKPGGVLVANFHKNQGIELVDSCLEERGGTIRQLHSPSGSERHGPYVAYLKEI